MSDSRPRLSLPSRRRLVHIPANSGRFRAFLTHSDFTRGADAWRVRVLPEGAGRAAPPRFTLHHVTSRPGLGDGLLAKFEDLEPFLEPQSDDQSHHLRVERG